MAQSVTARVAVVGAGYAGLAAATELAATGVAVDVFEASRTLGGRARAVQIDGLTLDNGAHILVGAYAETLRLMNLVGAPAAGLLRLPLHLEFPGHFRLHAPRLPAPLHLAWALLTAQGLTWSDKLAAIAFMRRQQGNRFRLSTDTTVSDLIAAQPDATRHFLWEPLCLAALNTAPGQASAQVFLNVLRDSLAAGRAASDLLLPATDFSSLFPEPAARFIAAHGGTVQRGLRIERVGRSDAGYRLDGHGPYAQVILAVAPQHLPPLIAELPELAPVVGQLRSYVWEPIVTCYLAYPESVRLPQPMLGVTDGTAQWLLDRGQSHGQQGLIAAVISASRRHREVEAPQLADAIHREIALIVPNLPAPRWTRVIAEQRATFACTPGVSRPLTVTALPGIFLAGDYVAGEYPATIEGAIRSGIAAARSICPPVTTSGNAE
jgi:squalene-associated FAD-dependent desaturase